MACLHCRRSERCNRSWMSLILTGMSEGWTSVKEPTQFNRLETLPLVTECESLLLLSEPDMMYFRRKKSIVFPRFSGFDASRFKWLLTLFPIAWCRCSPWQQPYKEENARTPPSPLWLCHHHLLTPWSRRLQLATMWGTCTVRSRFSENFRNNELTLERHEQLFFYV